MFFENKVMMNIIGKINDVDDIIKNLISINKVDLVSAVSQIEDNNLLFNINEESLEKLIDINSITFFNKNSSYEELLKNGEAISKILGIDSNFYQSDIVENISSNKIARELDKIYKEILIPNENMVKAKKELERIEKLFRNFQYADDLTIPIENLRNLQYFNYKLGVLSKENRLKLRKNYENIPSIIHHTGTSNDGEAYLVLYPSSLSEGMKRVLHSLNFKELIIPDEYKGTLWEIRNNIKKEMVELENKIIEHEKTLLNLKNQYKDRILVLLSQIKLIGKIEAIKEKLARSNRFFYLSGWVSLHDQSEMKKIVNNYDDMLILFNSETNLTPPTKVKGNWLFKHLRH